MQAVTKDPEAMSGAPLFRGTRVMVSTLWNYLETGATTEASVNDFPTVTPEGVLAVLGKAKALLEAQADAS